MGAPERSKDGLRRLHSSKHHTTDLMLCMRSRDDKLCHDAAAEIEWLHEYIKKLERRIHNQRAANRDTWEVVEMRRKWLGSDTARRMYAALLKRYQAAGAKAKAQIEQLQAECLEQARLLGKSGEREADLRGQIERLRQAIVWIDHHEPELVAAAETKFHTPLRSSD